MTIDLPEGVSSADEIALEHEGKSAHGGQIHDLDGGGDGGAWPLGPAA